MKKLGLIVLLFWPSSYATNRAMIDTLAWQQVYVINNTDVEVQVAADVTGIPTINILETGQAAPAHRETWPVPKREKKYGGVQKLVTLDRLKNITIKADVRDETNVPAWMIEEHAIHITHRRPDKVLIIYIGKTANRWLINQRYVTAVKKELYEGPSGYRLKIDQP